MMTRNLQTLHRPDELVDSELNFRDDDDLLEKNTYKDVEWAGFFEKEN